MLQLILFKVLERVVVDADGQEGSAVVIYNTGRNELKQEKTNKDKLVCENQNTCWLVGGQFISCNKMHIGHLKTMQLDFCWILYNFWILSHTVKVYL